MSRHYYTVAVLRKDHETATDSFGRYGYDAESATNIVAARKHMQRLIASGNYKRVQIIKRPAGVAVASWEAA